MGGPGLLGDSGGNRLCPFFTGLELSVTCPPVLPSPPINSLPPRLCAVREGVAGVLSVGEAGGVAVAFEDCVVPAGSKENSGNAVTDFR